MPPKIARKRNNVIRVLNVKLVNNHIDWSKHCKRPLVLITGDGNTLKDDVREFESWGLPHDLYCTNRSLLFFERQIDHWAAIDIEESCWFSQNVNQKVEPDKPILRHTIGECPVAYDIWWEMDYAWENDFQRRVFVGNTGYFAILTALNMGYEKVVLAGMPIDGNPHWYEPEEKEGPNWNGLTYRQWMDFKMKHEKAGQVKSLSGYSAFILGHATKEWADADRCVI
jgi:hypothetical protein